MQNPNFNEEIILWRQGIKFVIGIDEAGRGPLAGPVVAVAVCVRSNLNRDYDIEFLGINDSKKLSEKKRESLYEILINHKDVNFGVGIISEEVIDKINILEATKLAMAVAVENLEKNLESKAEFLLIDGNFILSDSLLLKTRTVLPNQKAIVKGDQKVFSIAMASIIAKVTRDKIMKEIHQLYPNYGFDLHKGYGTKLHIKNLKSFGRCKAHRLSFKFE